MRFSAIVGVKDEVELIERSIAHLHGIGVELVIACDFGSTDGTRQVLSELASENLLVVHRSDSGPDPGSAVRQMESDVAELVRELERRGFDWTLFLDADEFWLPRTGRIEDCAGVATADVIKVPRFNIPLGSIIPPSFDRDHHGEISLIVQPIESRDLFDDDPEAIWQRNVPLPKLMARPQVTRGVSAGMHTIDCFDEASIRRLAAHDLLIAHLPFSTRRRFDRKIRNILRFFSGKAGDLEGTMAWHWRRWASLAQAGQIGDEFDRNCFSPEVLDALRSRGMVKTAADVLAEGVPVG